MQFMMGIDKLFNLNNIFLVFSPRLNLCTTSVKIYAYTHTAKNEVYLLTYLKQALYPVFEILNSPNWRKAAATATHSQKLEV